MTQQHGRIPGRINADGNRLAYGSDDQTISLWDIKTEVPLGEFLTGQAGLISSIAFSPDGNTLASGSDGSTIVLWDIRDPASTLQLGTLLGNRASITSTAFNPDGKWLASGSNEGQVLLWDLRDEETRLQFTSIPVQDALSPYSVAFNTDGNLVIASLTTGDVILWNLQNDFWLQRACTLLAGKTFSTAEWNRYFPGEQFRDACSPSS